MDIDLAARTAQQAAQFAHGSRLAGTHQDLGPAATTHGALPSLLHYMGRKQSRRGKLAEAEGRTQEEQSSRSWSVPKSVRRKAAERQTDSDCRVGTCAG